MAAAEGESQTHHGVAVGYEGGGGGEDEDHQDQEVERIYAATVAGMDSRLEGGVVAAGRSLARDWD